MAYCGERDNFWSRWLYVLALLSALSHFVPPIPGLFFFFLTVPLTMLYSSLQGPYKGKGANQKALRQTRKGTRKKRTRRKTRRKTRRRKR